MAPSKNESPRGYEAYGESGSDEPTARDWRRKSVVRAAWVVLALLAVVGTVLGMNALRRRAIERRYAGDEGRAVVRVSRIPSWMPISLAGRVSDMITPPNASLSDEDLARKVYERARNNPLVARTTRVEVRPNAGRPGGVVEVDLEFRQPLACVNRPGGCVFVDELGVCMPKELVPRYVLTGRDPKTGKVRQVCYQTRAEVPRGWRKLARPIHYVVIDGVSSPPPKDGPWKAADLAAGINLIKLIRCKPYFAQVAVVDVRNHGGRISRFEPELRICARMGQGRETDIRFGRLPRPGGDSVVSPARKVWYLDCYAATHDGNIAGINRYLDLRYDNLHVSLN